MNVADRTKEARKPKTLTQLKSERGLIHKPRDNRGGSTKRGYGSRWQRARATYLRQNPLCIECEKEGRTEQAIVVDHIKPHKGDMNLFWDRTNNWQSLCKRHHDIKTASEDGGFGYKNNKEVSGVGAGKSLQPDER